MTIFLYLGRCFPKVFFKSTTEDAETGKTGKFTDLGYCILPDCRSLSAWFMRTVLIKSDGD